MSAAPTTEWKARIRMNATDEAEKQPSRLRRATKTVVASAVAAATVSGVIELGQQVVDLLVRVFSML